MNAWSVKDKEERRHWYLLLLVMVTVGLKLVLARDMTLFWDAIASLAAPSNYFYEHRLETFLFDSPIDNGDPHLLHYLLAAAWQVCGRSLWVTHGFMLPFVIGTTVFLFKLCDRLLPSEDGVVALLATCLVLADPSVLTQLMLIGMDAMLLCFGVMAVYCLFTEKRWGLALVLPFLCLCNRRGMIVAACILLIFFLRQGVRHGDGRWGRRLLGACLCALPAICTVGGYLLVRYCHYGWVFTHPASPYAFTSQPADFSFFIKNCLAYGWFNLDFSRLFIWVVVLGLLAKFRVRCWQVLSADQRWLLVLYVVLHVAFLSVTLPIRNPFGARYLILHFACLAILCSVWLYHLLNRSRAVLISISLTVASCAGNLILYPEKMAQNWDCTLRHVSFYPLRQQALDYLHQQGIPLSQVAGGFCIADEMKNICLTPSSDRITQEVDADGVRYYLYSNISNCDDELIDRLHGLPVVASFSSHGVFVRVIALH